MKVLYLSTLDIVGGAARGAYRLHRGFLEHGVDSTMLVAQKFSDDPTVLGPATDPQLRAWRRRKDWSRAVLRLMRTPNPIVKSLNLFPTGTHRLVNDFSPDIVQMHWIGSEFISIAEVARIERPIVWRLADQWAFGGAEHYCQPGDEYRFSEGFTTENRPKGYAGLDLDRWTWLRKMKHWRRKPMTIVTGSHWLAECARSSTLFRDRRVEAIPSGLDVRVYRPLGRRTAREILNLPQDARLVLFGALSATSDSRKGFQFLAPTLKRLAARSTERIEALVLGASRPTSPPDFGVPTTYVPKLSDDSSLALLYSAADVLLAPSLQDNLPFSVMEAQACGTPCVAFDIGGMPDMIEHLANGYLAKAFESDDLADGLAYVLADETRREAMGRACRDKAEREYAVQVQVQRYLNLYDDVLSGRG